MPTRHGEERTYGYYKPQPTPHWTSGREGAKFQLDGYADIAHPPVDEKPPYYTTDEIHRYQKVKEQRFSL